MVTVSFRVDDYLKDRLDRLVERRGLSVSRFFRQVLSHGLDDLEQGGDRQGAMNLTLKERLTFSSQFKIIAALYPNEREYYLRHVEALESGYEFHYRSIVERFSDGLSAEESREVLEVLDLYSDLNWAYHHLENKSDIDEWQIRFAGFCGNTESEKMAYARYFTIDLDRFNSLHDDIRKYGLNSHCPMTQTYRRMLVAWKRIPRSRDPLSLERMKEIISAASLT